VVIRFCFFFIGKKKKERVIKAKAMGKAVKKHTKRPKTDDLDAIFIPHDVMDRQSWYAENVPVFNNLSNIDQQVGYIKPLIDYDEYKKRCYTNCDQLELIFPENCKWFCDYKTDLKRNSVQYAKQACPTGDKSCCKEVAKDNDLAYLYCINAKDLYRVNPSRDRTLFYILLFISLTFITLTVLFVGFIL
jgi:hypothetical protein